MVKVRLACPCLPRPRAPELAPRGTLKPWLPRSETAKTSVSDDVSMSESVVAMEAEAAVMDETREPVDAKYLSASVASSRRVFDVVPVLVV